MPVIAAMLRLGGKFKVQELYDDALARLVFTYPSTLKAHDHLHLSGNQWDKVQHYPGIDFDAVNLAREMELHTILPYTFYRVCLCGPRLVQEGVLTHAGEEFGPSSQLLLAD